MDPDLSAESISYLIRSRRIRKGITQHQLAGLSAISVRAIRDLERGRTYRPHPNTLRRLLSALGISLDEAATAAMSDGPAGRVRAGQPSYPLPIPTETIIGRNDDVLALSRALPADGNRVVAITGLPGVGKTRVAVEVANSLTHARELPVTWVPVGCGSAEAAISGWQTSRNVAVSAGDWVAAVVSEGPAVVIFDGCDQDRRHAARIAAVLRRYPLLRVLVTSRAPLGVTGERVMPLGPLTVPDRVSDNVEQLMEIPSIQLLVRAARREWPSFGLNPDNAAVVAELCRRLDGVPALLEGVAAALRLLDPDALLECLASDPEGTLADIAPGILPAVRQAVSMLEPTEALLLDRLVSASCSWSVANAATLSGASLTVVARQVRRLLQLGLIRIESTSLQVRFRVIELVRTLRGALSMQMTAASGGSQLPMGAS